MNSITKWLLHTQNEWILNEICLTHVTTKKLFKPHNLNILKKSIKMYFIQFRFSSLKNYSYVIIDYPLLASFFQISNSRYSSLHFHQLIKKNSNLYQFWYNFNFLIVSTQLKFSMFLIHRCSSTTISRTHAREWRMNDDIVTGRCCSSNSILHTHMMNEDTWRLQFEYIFVDFEFLLQLPIIFRW